MAVTKVLNTIPATYAHTDDENTVYLEKRTPNYSGGRQSTDDIWTGSIDAIRELYTEFLDNTYLGTMRINQTGRKGELAVSWTAAMLDDEAVTPEDDPGLGQDENETWSFRALEIPTPLAAHPYFQVPYFPAAGDFMEDEMARCELAIKRGRAYEAAGEYADYIKRYYALRMAGVEEWTQYGVELTRRYKAFARADAEAATADVGTVLQAAAIPNLPADLLAAIQNLPKITDYNTSDPDSYVLGRQLFEFVVRPPQVGFTLNGGQPVFEIEASYLGVQQWSKVIYPGGTWDPDGTS